LIIDGERIMVLKTDNSLKKRLINNMDKLPETDIQEVLDFIEFLLRKRSKKKMVAQKSEVDPAEDPILKLLGIADVDPFANKVDQELYG
jgi:hypothetical protein